MGRKRQPTELKLSRGTHERHRDGDPALEPKPLVLTEVPPAPEHLKDAGRERWEDDGQRMVQLRLLTAHDLTAFTHYCEFCDEKAYLEQLLETEGDYARLDNGRTFQHPAVARLENVLTRIRRAQDQFGMTPTSRGGLQVASPQSPGINVRKRV